LETLINQADERLFKLGELLRHGYSDIRDIASRKSIITNISDDYTIIKSMINQELEKFASDRTGLTDFALMSAGARIVPSLTSPSFPSESKFGFMFRRKTMSTKPPETVLNVGNLWGLFIFS
jgi:hypothetical protein